MATATGVTLAEYLATDYKPDREYVDGEVRERNPGQGPHSYTQMALGAGFYAQQKRWGVLTLPEQRVQVSETHYRVPDLCVVRKEDFAKIIRQPPLLCIEILSPEDRWNRLQESIDDYLQSGVPEIWVIDPEDAKAWLCTPVGVRLVADNILRWKDLTIELREIQPGDMDE
jgi:Uma2 family endonuclease